MPPRRPPAGQSFVDTYPAHAEQWHPTKNGSLRPDAVSAACNTRVWWQCQDNPAHEWATTVNNRRRCRADCPFCRGRHAGAGSCLQDTHPKLAAEWHPSRNGALTPTTCIPTSRLTVWWQCTSDPTHEWHNSPNNRVTDGSGCPMCSGRRVTEATSLAALYPEIAAEVCPERNGDRTASTLRPGSNHPVWWRCARDAAHTWTATPYSRTGLGTGCPWCSGLRLEAHRALAAVAPAVAAEWHPTRNTQDDPTTIAARSPKRRWWACGQCGGEWKAAVAQRTTKHTGCPHCTVAGTSWQEIALRHELQAVLGVAIAPTTLTVAGTRYAVDMAFPWGEHTVVIEYDGAFFHRDREARDRAKAVALMGAGYVVLRVRDGDLAQLHDQDVLAPRRFDLFAAAAGTLHAIEEATEVVIPGLLDYLIGGRPIAEAEARAAYGALRQTRARRARRRAA